MKINPRNLKYYFLTMSGDEEKRRHMTSLLMGLDFSEINPFEVGVDKNLSGSIGHARMVERGLQEQDKNQPFQPFVILEDDVEFFRDLPDSFDLPLDTDLAYLGISQLGMVDGKWEEKIYATEVDENTVQLFNMLSGHAILIASASGAAAYQKAMLEGYHRKSSSMWDVLAAEIQPYYNVYAFKKPIFYQSEEFGGKEAATRFVLKKFHSPSGLPINKTNASCKIASINHQNLDFLRHLGEIPSTVHVSWKSKGVVNSQNPLILNGLRQLIDLNPSWDVQISDDNDVNNYLEQHLSVPDFKLFQDLPMVPKTDVWRLLKIYIEGGLYMDLDRHCNIHLDTLRSASLKCILPFHSSIDFSQDILFSAPRNPLYQTIIELNLRRRRSGWKDILTLAPITYFHGLTKEIYGHSLNRYPSPNLLQELFEIINKSPYVDSYLETPPKDTLLFKFDPNTWKNGNGGSKEDLYLESDVSHWTSANPIKRDDRKFE